MRRLDAPSRSFFEGLHLALAHRFEPGALYMAMTAYFDESGTHGANSPAIIVAGFGATVAQWNGCEKRLKKLFNDYAVRAFHAKEFRGTDGDFKGWDVGRKGKFLSRFLKIIDEQLAFAVSARMAPADYKQYYRENPFPRSVQPDTACGLGFRVALARSLRNYRDQPHDWPLNVVLELGHKNWQDAARTFKELKNDPRFDRMLGTVSFATKVDCIFLGTADALAYALFRNAGGYSERQANPNLMPLGPADPPYYVHQPRMSRILLDARSLRSLYRIHCTSSARALASRGRSS